MGSVAVSRELPADECRISSRKINPLVREIPAASVSRPSEFQILCSRSLAGLRNAVWNTPYKERMHNTMATGLASSTNTVSTSLWQTVYRFLSAIGCGIGRAISEPFSDVRVDAVGAHEPRNQDRKIKDAEDRFEDGNGTC